MDEKRRFSLPPKYRPLFSARTLPSGTTYLFVLAPWYGGSLAAFPEARWNEIQSRLLLLDYTTPDFLEAKRQCLSRMEFSHTDPEGRILLTPDQHEWMRLPSKGKSRVVVVGVGQHLEIWNAEEWPEVQRTGKNPATRAAADIEYDKKLEILMRAGREEWLARGGAQPEPPAGTEEKQED